MKYPAALIMLLFSGILLKSQDTITVGPVKTLKYFELGPGYTTESHTDVNACISTDISNLMGFFLNYDLILKRSEILAHQISMMAGPFQRVNENSYLALSAGLSFLFSNEGISQREPGYRHRFILSVPVQLKFAVGIAPRWGFGTKGTYFLTLSEGEENTAAAVIYVSYRLED